MVEKRILKSTCLGPAGVDGLAEVPSEHPICDGWGGTSSSLTDNKGGVCTRGVQALLMAPSTSMCGESVCT